MARKLATELKPGDKLESSSGILTIVRTHTMWPTVSIIATDSHGRLTEWANYNVHDEFDTVTVH